MAQRPNGFAKKPPASRADRLGLPARAAEGGQIIPLKLRPMLAPYKKRGRLALRIERMPQVARLSAGRNNGNNSWSLTVEELDDLTYLLPRGFNEPHALSVRIIGLDEGGSTITVSDYAVSPETDAINTPDASDEDESDNEPASPQDDEYLRKLSDELTKVKGTLAAREAELAKTRQTTEQSHIAALRDTIDTELTSARAAWKLDTEQRLAAAATAAAATLEKHRTAWQDEQNTRVAQVEERTRASIVEARERWRQEAKTAFTKAENTWRAEETTRMAKAEAQWQQKLAQAQGEARQSTSDNDEIQRLNAALKAAQTSLNERDATLAGLRTAVEQTRANGQKDSTAALTNAQAQWRAEETARLASARSSWQADAAQALAETIARAERAEAAVAQAESEATLAHAAGKGWRDDLLSVQTKLRDREAELAQAQAKADAAIARAADTTAQDTLRAELASTQVKLADREVSLAQARSDAEEQRKRAADTSVQDGLRTDLSAANAKLSDRETALTHARSESEELRKRLADTSALNAVRTELSAAKGILAEREAALARAHSDSGDLRKQAADTGALRTELSAANAKLADRETALTRTLADANDFRMRAADADTLRTELSSAKTKLAESEAALARMRAEAEQQQQNSDELSLLSGLSVLDALRAELNTAKEALADSENRLVHSRADLAAAHNLAADPAIVENLRGELATARVKLIEQESLLVEATEKAERALNDPEVDNLRVTLAAAQIDLAARTAELEQLRPGIASLPESEIQAELARTRGELSATQAVLSERQAQLDDLRSGDGRASETTRGDLDKALAEAKALWKVEEAKRLAAAETRWRDESAVALVEAKARYEAAEAGLAQLRLRAERDQADENSDVRFGEKFAALQSQLAARDNELTYARSLLERNGILVPGADLNNMAKREEASRTANTGWWSAFRLTAELSLALSLAVGAFVYFPEAIALMPDSWQENIETVDAAIQSALGRAPAEASTVAAAAPVTSTEAPATAIHSAKMRVSPSVKSAVTATVSRNSAVTAVRQKGNWTYVRRADGKEGWVFTSYLALSAAKTATNSGTKSAAASH